MSTECECGNQKRTKRAVACPGCIEIDERRLRAESPTRRIVAVLKHQGWCTSADVYDAMGAVLPGKRVSTILSRLADIGVALRRKNEHGGCLYRLVRRAA